MPPKLYGKCCVPKCNSLRQDVTLHNFPLTEEIKRQWIKCIFSESDETDSSTKDRRLQFVCHKHFEKRFERAGTNRLTRNAYPSLFTDEEISSGNPTRVILETGTAETVNMDHKYARKRHFDHSYVKSREIEYSLHYVPKSGAIRATLRATKAGPSSADQTAIVESELKQIENATGGELCACSEQICIRSAIIHVTVSQLQMIKLVGIEPGKKGKSNLKFLVGNRVTNMFQRMLDREKALTGLLKNEPTKHEELVQKLQKNIKITNKNLQNVLAELAQYEVDKIRSIQPKPKYVFMFKKEATPEFNRAICKGLDGEDLFIFLASEEPDKPKEGQILIQGPEEYCNALGQQITELLKGKGAFKHGKFQGKAGDLSGINKCKKLVEDYFNNLNT